MDPLPPELTPEALGELLATEVSTVVAAPIGTGQMGRCYRVDVEYADEAGLPSRLLVKLPAEDPATRAMVTGVYRSEVGFYRDVVSTLTVRTPDLVGARWPDDEGNYVLALELLDGFTQGDQLTGCTPRQALAATRNLVGLHAPRWCDPTLESETLRRAAEEDISLLGELYESTAHLFFDVVGDLVDDRTRQVILDCGEVVVPWSQSLVRRDVFAPVHGDYRLDNLLFSDTDPEVVAAVDWQTLSLTLPTRDLSYLLGTGLPTEDRRRHEEDLVGSYHEGLVRHGVTDYGRDACWDDYVLSMIQGPLVAIFGCAFGEKTPRGAQMFAAMVNRACAAMDDLGTVSRARQL